MIYKKTNTRKNDDGETKFEKLPDNTNEKFKPQKPRRMKKTEMTEQKWLRMKNNFTEITRDTIEVQEITGGMKQTVDG